jgi:MFS family permease
MLVSFMSTAGIALPYPVLAPYFLRAETDGLTGFAGVPPKLLLGVLLAIYPLGVLVGNSFLGVLSDHLGRRRVLIVSLCCAATGYLATAVAVVVHSFPLMALARFMTGLFEGNDAIARAIALDLHPTIDRTRTLSLANAAIHTGWLAGPLAGGFLAAFGVAAVFLVAGMALLACAGFAAATLIDTAATRPAATRTMAEVAQRFNSLLLWREPPIRALLVYHLLYTMGLNACYEFYPLWLVESFGSDSRRIGWLTVYMTGAMVVTGVFAFTRLRARVDALALVRGSALGFAVLLLLLVRSPETAVPWLFCGLGTMIAVNSSSFPDYMTERFSAAGTGRVLGLISTNFYASNVVIALAGSALALLGSAWSLLLGAVLCGLAVAWLLVVAPPRLPAGRAAGVSVSS